MAVATYEGGCHCGSIRFKTDIDLQQLIACNCSICTKRGYILGFAGPQQFQLLQGSSALQDYLFYKKSIHHNFCKTCGTGVFGQGVSPKGEDMVAVNVRCLDGVDIDSLKPQRVDGKKF